MIYIAILALFIIFMIRARNSQVPDMPENGKKVSAMGQ